MTAHKWVDIPYLQEAQSVDRVFLIGGCIRHEGAERIENFKKHKRDELRKEVLASASEWIERQDDPQNYFIGAAEFTEDEHVDPTIRDIRIRCRVLIYRNVIRRITPSRFLMEYMLRRIPGVNDWPEGGGTD